MQTEHKTVHQGRNVKRIREILGIKQEVLASGLGITQQAISQLEGKEALDKEVIEKVAAVLKVPVNAIQEFNDDSAINFISSTFHDNASIINTNCTLNINPVEKWMEAMEENKKLYEALLKSEREKVALLERMLEGK